MNLILLLGLPKETMKIYKKYKNIGILLYTAKSYQKAIPFLKESLTSNNYNENYLYIGVCYIKTNQLDSAYTYLQNTPIFLPELTDAARWYLAIYFLKIRKNLIIVNPF